MNLKSPDSTGMVVGIEHYPKLVEFSIDNLNTDDPEMIKSGKLKIVQGDGRKGYEKYAPYDAIYVGAASEKIPTKLLKQLKNGGRMLCPVGAEDEQELVQYDKTLSGEIKKKNLVAVAFVPLTDLDTDLDLDPFEDLDYR
jgi:protein-L-isoaspartate(D-aspartate) O-methyltransferase